MKTREQILNAINNGKKSQCLDDRDFSRLVDFFPVKDWTVFGFELQEDATPKIQELTKDNILVQLKEDVAFGFEKALGKRGISAGFMNEVVLMWMWVLDDDLQHHSEYSMYGLPLLKAVALKYGFENQIGKNSGAEKKYNAV